MQNDLDNIVEGHAEKVEIETQKVKRLVEKKVKEAGLFKLKNGILRSVEQKNIKYQNYLYQNFYQYSRMYNLERGDSEICTYIK